MAIVSVMHSPTTFPRDRIRYTCPYPIYHSSSETCCRYTIRDLESNQDLSLRVDFISGTHPTSATLGIGRQAVVETLSVLGLTPHLQYKMVAGVGFEPARREAAEPKSAVTAIPPPRHLEPAEGVEPPTLSLQMRCTAIVLHRLWF